MRRFLWAFFLALPLLSCNDSPFPDSAFEKCVETARSSLHLKDYHDLTILVCDSNNISNIAGIQELKDVDYIRMNDNFIRDIGPLAELKKLKHLELQDNYLTIEALAVLSQLTTLEYLNIDDNCLYGPTEKEDEVFGKIHESNPDIEIDGNLLNMKSAEECQ